MFKAPSSKAAASEEARRTLWYGEPLSDARTPLEGVFNILPVDRPFLHLAFMRAVFWPLTPPGPIHFEG